MEEVKRAPAHRFCADSGRSPEEVRAKIFSIAREARGYYAACDAYDLGGNGQLLIVDDEFIDEFVEMMFADGCFLLQFMFKGNEPPIVGHFLSSGPSILKDIFLLENQIPWLVLEALAEFVPMDDGLAIEDYVLNFIVDHMKGYFFVDGSRNKENKARLCFQSLVTKCRCTAAHEGDNKDPVGRSYSHGDHHPKPPHLLGLLRYSMTRGTPAKKRRSELSNRIVFPRLSCSAVDLARIGVNLTVSRAAVVMNFQKQPVSGELSLSPLFLNNVAACCLVNLAALEVAEATSASSTESDGFVVSSYLSVLARLLEQEEDVHELRRKGVLYSNFSNTQTLDFFREIVQNVRQGYNYYAVIEEIDLYMSQRPVRIAVHRLAYNSFKTMTIATLFSIAGVDAARQQEEIVTFHEVINSRNILPVEF